MDLQPWEYFDADFERKRTFAESLLRKKNPLDAAQEIFGNDFPKAYQASVNWPICRIVKAIQADLLARHGEEYFLPTAHDVAWKLWEMANAKSETGRFIYEGKERIAAYKDYVEVRGFSEKKGDAGGNIVNNVRLTVVSPDQAGNAPPKVIEGSTNEESKLLPFPQLRFAKNEK